MVIEPLGAAVAKGSVVDFVHHTFVRRCFGVVQPYRDDSRGEKEEDCVDQCLVFADEEVQLEVVVMVGVERAPPPADGTRRTAEKRAYETKT